MIRDDHRCAADVVRVVGLGELVAQSRDWVIQQRTAPLRVGRVWRVDLHFNRVDPGWHNWLTVSAIEEEELPSELEDIGVGPTRADALEARQRVRSTGAIRPRAIAVV